MFYLPFLRPLPACILFLSLVSLTARGATPDKPPSTLLVIGFVGGRVAHTNAVHQEVQLATHLRKEYPLGMDAQVFENHSGPLAHQAILRLLDTDHDGSLSAIEKLKARIILYGHSWGASEAVTTARALERDGIPVLLTIQVDSVSKHGEDDRLIPANVAQAINLYELDGMLHGRAEILAADPQRTKILGNIRFDYKTRSANCKDYPWFARMFMRPHIEMESDPKVWSRIEALIRSKMNDSAKSSAVALDLQTIHPF
jgi:hypothetical protein